MELTPHNRHILIEMPDETEDSSESATFLLPEGYEKPKSEANATDGGFDARFHAGC